MTNQLLLIPQPVTLSVVIPTDVSNCLWQQLLGKFILKLTIFITKSLIHLGTLFLHIMWEVSYQILQHLLLHFLKKRGRMIQIKTMQLRYEGFKPSLPYHILDKNPSSPHCCWLGGRWYNIKAAQESPISVGEIAQGRGLLKTVYQTRLTKAFFKKCS